VFNRLEFQSISIPSGSDPQLPLTKLYHLYRQIVNNGMALPEQFLITRVLSMLPKEYQTVLFQVQMNGINTFSQIMKLVIDHYRTLTNYSTMVGSNSKEVNPVQPESAAAAAKRAGKKEESFSA